MKDNKRYKKIPEKTDSKEGKEIMCQGSKKIIVAPDTYLNIMNYPEGQRKTHTV